MTAPSFCVVAFPVFRSAQDRGWVEQLTGALRPVLPPHLTLVFPTPTPDRAEIIDEVAHRVAGWPPFEVVFRAATAMPPVLANDVWHTFLVPDEGTSQLVKLRAFLHAGKLRPCERTDLPYWPHVTVGRFPEAARARRLAKRLNGWGIEVYARIEAVAVLTLQKGSAVISAELPLSPGTPGA